MKRDTDIHEALEKTGVDYDHIKATGTQQKEDISEGSRLAAEKESEEGMATWISVGGGHSLLANGRWYWLNPLIDEMKNEVMPSNQIASKD